MGLQKSLKIGDILIQESLILEAQLTQALAMQKISKKKLGEILIENGMITEKKFLKVLADTYQLETIELDDVVIDEKLLSSFPFALLEKHKVLPIEIKDQTLIVAINDPLDVLILQELRYISGQQVKPMLASLKDILRYLRKSHQSMETAQAIRNAQNVDAQGTPIIKLVNSIISRAIKEGASDIHLEPQKDQLRVRFRIDGILFQKLTIPKDLFRKVISGIKIMGGLDVAENRKPQEGRISWKEGDYGFDIRVSTLLDMHGEKMTLRILNKKEISHTFDSLGMNNHEINQIKELIKRPYGMLLVTGPTGAGKTTTLYSILNSLNQISTNIITVEDPVEYQMEGITQTSINPYTGYTFASAIRYILRHDPDIIMVGEIRDGETAEVSVRAALTGHLVLATLHTNSAAGAVTRLMDMGVESFLLSSTVVGVVAQRLVRKLCPHCKRQEDASEDIREIITRELSLTGPVRVAHPVGCEQCFHTGYSGRVGLFEILRVTPDIRALILKKASEKEITQALIAQGMKTLRMAGYQKVIEKVTSYEEVLRVTLTEDM